MMHKNFYFRSFQVAVLAFILIVMAGCSLYPSIEPHKPTSMPSTIFTNLVATDSHSKLVDLPNEQQEATDGQSYTGASDKMGNVAADSQAHYSEFYEIEPIEEVLEKADSSIDQEEAPSSIHEEEQQQSMKIAITFDDGPDLKFTPQILDILQEKKVVATFFVVGIQVKKYPEVLQRIEAEGHLIGNHSYNHPNFTKLTREELADEITRTDELIFGAVGHVPTIVRPPYGAINDASYAQIEEMDKSVMLWNIDPRDWDGSSVEDMLENILANAKDGGNILLHSFGSKHVENTVTLLPLVIDELRELGYEFVTADEL